MDRSIARRLTALNLPFAALLDAARTLLRRRADAARLDALPRDRMDDIGLAPRSAANRRHSGEGGRAPQVTLW